MIVPLKDKRTYVLWLLNIMNHYYSLRDIERMLGIPFQVLWRYVNFITVPEGKTADKILSKVRDEGIISKLIMKSLMNSTIPKLLRSPGFIKLFSFVVADFIGRTRINVIFPLSEAAITLATGVSLTIDAEVCVIGSRVLYDRKGFVATYYVLSSTKHEVESMIIPKSCLKEGSSALLVDVILSHVDIDKIKALTEVLRRFKVEPIYLATINACEEVIGSLTALGIRYLVFNSAALNFKTKLIKYPSE